MTPKEVVQKGYDCFSTGDMATFKTLFSDSAIIKNNGMHKFSGTYHGAEDFINNLLAHIPSHFVNFKVETVQMISEGNHVFSMLHATAELHAIQILEALISQALILGVGFSKPRL